MTDKELTPNIYKQLTNSTSKKKKQKNEETDLKISRMK